MLLPARLITAAFLTALTALFVLPAAAHAQAQWSEPLAPCLDENSVRVPNWQCGELLVPLDWQRPQGPQIELAVVRWHRPGPKRPAWVSLAGGPGQAAIPLALSMHRSLYQPLRQTGEDLLVLDVRGSGASGAIDCPALQRSISFTAKTFAQCANQLGSKAGHYSSWAMARDLDALRQLLRLPTLSIMGTSYGSRLALQYAVDFPERTRRLALVSPSSPLESTIYRSRLVAVPRVLSSFCLATLSPCAQEGFSPRQDLVRSLALARSGKLSAPVYLADGRRVLTRVSAEDILYLAAIHDEAPAIAGDLLSALNAAAEGDAALLAQMTHAALRAAPAQLPANSMSSGAYAAVHCNDLSLPWPASEKSWRRRLDLLRASAHNSVDGTYWPFTAAEALNSADAPGCIGWPTAHRRRSLDLRHSSRIPTLILVGSQDVRTPVEEAQALHERLTNSTLVVVPQTGHDPIGNREGCAVAHLHAFIERRVLAKSRTCAAQPLHEAHDMRPRLTPPADPELAQRLGLSEDLPESVRQTALGIEHTVYSLDWIYQMNDYGRQGGLRGGTLNIWLRKNSDRVCMGLNQYEYVQGVRLTGRLCMDASARFIGTLRLAGRSRGQVQIKPQRTDALIDGHATSWRWRYDLTAEQAEEDAARSSAPALRMHSGKVD